MFNCAQTLFMSQSCLASSDELFPVFSNVINTAMREFSYIWSKMNCYLHTFNTVYFSFSCWCLLSSEGILQ